MVKISKGDLKPLYISDYNIKNKSKGFVDMHTYN